MPTLRMGSAGLAILLAASGVCADEPVPGLAVDETAFVAWWDSLGYPDLAKVPFVRFSPGSRPHYANGSHPDEYWDQGFLLADTGATFTTFSTDLRTTTWARVPPDWAWTTVGYEKIDLDAMVRAGLPTLAATDVDGIPEGDPFAYRR